MPSRRTFRIITGGGLGDGLLVTPTLRELKKQFPDCKIILFCRNARQMDLFKHNPRVDGIHTGSFWRSPVTYLRHYFKLSPFYETTFQRIPPTFVYEKHAKDILAEMFGVQLSDPQLEVFLTPREEAFARNVLAPYRNPVVLHATSTCSVNHLWPSGRWEALVEKMPDLTFIQVGTAGEKAVKGAVDLRGKTTVREGMALVKHATGFVGVEAFFGHVANAVGTPGVVLFGDSDPNTWGHETNLNLSKNMPCAPCYNLLWGDRCPYDNACMKNISVPEVMAAVRRMTGLRQPQPAGAAALG